MGDEKTKTLWHGGFSLAHRRVLSMLLVFAGSLALSGFFLVTFFPSPARAAFGFESLGSTFVAVGGAGEALLAGSHPESWTAMLTLNADGPLEERHPQGTLKDLRIELPSGLAAVPALLPHCSHAEFREEECPAASAVGLATFVTVLGLPPATLFLLEPLPGNAAELGFHLGEDPVTVDAVTIDLSISPDAPYAFLASITNISQAAEFLGVTLTLEGAPNGTPLISLPRRCGQLETNFTASSWEEPTGAIQEGAQEPQPVIGCDSLRYSPSLEIGPTTTDVSSPSGLNLVLDAPDQGISSITGRAAADTQSASVVLPPGLTINPPAASRLTACTAAQAAAEEPDAPPRQGCPTTSRLGSATVVTPLFSEPIDGSVYLGLPEGSAPVIATSQSAMRLTLYLVFRNAERGILLRVPMQLDADPSTGQLSASLDQIPQLPISRLELHFNSGPRAPLTTSATCGSEAISYSLTPSSGNPPARGADSFTVSGPGCNARFAPTLSGGTTSNAAGRSAAFVFELSQGAPAPNPTSLGLTLPPGLSAALGAVPLCSEGQTVGGECAAASKLGYARIAVGSGPEPLWVPPGEEPDSAVYLAGPYQGAPYSLLIVVPAQAGPFDLGTVVLRAPIAIDPATAQASLHINGLPQVLSGIPLRYRAIRVVLDRPGFIRNPTSCEPTEIIGVASSSDGHSADLSSRFQAADCAALRFKPRVSLGLSGALGRNGHPAVRAVLRNNPDGASLSDASFTFPSGELLDLRHVRKLCPREAAVGQCPSGSRLGQLRLDSPLAAEPIMGPVYLRVPSHRLPDLSAELSAGGMRFDLRGRTTSAGGRLRVSLDSLPDIPISRAVLSFAGGRGGIVVNSRSLCAGAGRATAQLSAHNGRRLRLAVRPRVAC